jgi:putative endonuclease
MEYWVYILQSEKDGGYYIGYTADLEERLKRHNERRSRYTRNKTPWKFIYQEDFSTRTEAIRREREIKRMKSREYIERLVSVPPS